MFMFQTTTKDSSWRYVNIEVDTPKKGVNRDKWKEVIRDYSIRKEIKQF